MTSPAGALPESLGPSAANRGRRSTKLSEILARELLDYIVGDALKPGTRLPPEAAMVEHYDVGRSSLREALRILEVYGIVSIRPGAQGGPVVEEVGPRQLARLLMFYLNVKGVSFSDLADGRRLLQAAMAAEAARRRDPEQIKRMRDALGRAEAAEDDVSYGAAVHEFHQALFQAPGGELLGLLHDALFQILLVRLRRQISVEKARELSDDHKALLDAIVEGDVEAASRLITQHLEELDVLYDEVVPGLRAQLISWS